MQRLNQHPYRDRGAVVPLVALLLPVLMIMTALAVDLGRQRVLRRDLQADADVIALDLVRLADGRSKAEIENDPTYRDYVNGSFERNGIPPVGSVSELLDVVTFGTWNETAAVPFDPAGDPPNAVRVSLDGVVDYRFQPGSGGSTREAVASQTPRAGFSIGSYAAAVNSGGSALLNPLLGDALGLGVLGYDGLATTSLTFLDIAAEMGLLTPEKLFSEQVSALDVLTESAEILRRGDPAAARVALLDQIIEAPATGLDGVSIVDVIQMSAGSEEAALTSTVNLFDFLATSAFLANGDRGLGIPSIDLGVPGAQLNGELFLIQAPTTVFGEVGDFGETSQVDATLTATAGTINLGDFTTSTIDSVLPGTGDVLCNLLRVLPLLCGSSRTSVTAELHATVSLDLATAEGTIASIRCPGPEMLDIDIASQLLTTRIDIDVRLKTGSTVLGTVPVGFTNTRDAVTDASVNFVIPPDQFDVFKSATPAVGPLLGTTTVSGLGTLGSLLTPVLDTALQSITTTINSSLVTPLATALGVSLASADVAARAIDCRGAKLVA